MSQYKESQIISQLEYFSVEQLERWRAFFEDGAPKPNSYNPDCMKKENLRLLKQVLKHKEKRTILTPDDLSTEQRNRVVEKLSYQTIDDLEQWRAFFEDGAPKPDDHVPYYVMYLSLLKEMLERKRNGPGWGTLWQALGAPKN